MKLSIISFTETGKKLSQNIGKKGKEIEIHLFSKSKTCITNEKNESILYVETSIGDWARRQMKEKNALLFIGACGIAVRAIAPYIRDKLHDSPVLVMDEKGKYVIPILSGHVGGANEMARYLAQKIGAEPVITTATDIQGKFAVDLFAKNNHLYIVNKDGIVKVSSKILAGKEITLSIEEGNNMDKKEKAHVPEGVTIAPYPPMEPVDVLVTSKEETFDASILLRPKEYVIGMGCKRGKSSVEIGDFILKKIDELGISMAQIWALSSISLKQDEQGIIEWCQKEGIPFLTYTAQELEEVQGNFKTSSFVKNKVGVDNVCERAALKACGLDGKLIYEKCSFNGMTIAIAKRKWKVRFYGE